MSTPFRTRAANIIAGFEGYISNATWDVNAYRLGFGSDTITLDDGTYRIVKKGDVTSLENAKKDLARRIPEFEKEIRHYVGDGYDKLSDNAKLAVLSVTYNYGVAGALSKSKHPNLNEAVKKGDSKAVGEAIINDTINDNKGTNFYNYARLRRSTESAIAKTDSGNVNNIKRVGNTFNISKEYAQIFSNPSGGKAAPAIIGTIGLIAVLTLGYYLYKKI
jgi:GH24 family phage-related lysozyme (muramidase)